MTQQHLQQTQVPLATMPITGQTVVTSVAPPGVQAAVPRDPTAMMQAVALPIPGQAVAQPAAPAAQPPAQLAPVPQLVTPQVVAAPVAPQVLQAPAPAAATPLPATVQLPAVPPVAIVPAAPVAPAAPIPITAANLAALGHVPPVAPVAPAASVAPVAPAAVPPAPAAAPAAAPPNGAPPANGQVAMQLPVDLVRSDDAKVQGLLNRQRDQLTQAFEAQQIRANMAEGDRLRAETADAQALSQRYAAVAVEAQQSYQLASALMSSGAQLQPNAQTLIESQVKPLLAQGIPAPQALQHVAQSHPYLFQPAQPAPGQPGALPTPESILGIAAPPATVPAVPVFQPPAPLFPTQAPQAPQAPQYGAPVQAVFANPSTGFMGQGGAAPGSPPAGVAQPGQPVDLRSASPKEFRDWKLANGIHN